MPILTTCPGCGTQLKAPDHLAGKKVKCPRCSSLATVPLPEEPAPTEEEDLAAALPEEPEPAPSARRARAERDRAAPPPARRTVNVLGLVALIIGVGALLFSLIPCLGFLSLPFSALGLLLSLIALVIALTGRRWGLAAPLVGTVVCLVALAMPFAMTYLIGTQPARNLARADQLYGSGRQAEALPLYKDNFLFATDKAKVLRRIVEEEAKEGHEEEAKSWIKKGIDQGMVVTYDDPHSKMLAAEV
ncbi:MAG: hypothetical protein JO112_22130, partial [Planctomycetes bacterium]|nr:hypothetical protein [Planctomycetota bacterium]